MHSLHHWEPSILFVDAAFSKRDKTVCYLQYRPLLRLLCSKNRNFNEERNGYGQSGFVRLLSTIVAPTEKSRNQKPVPENDPPALTVLEEFTRESGLSAELWSVHTFKGILET
jgi:hypothetical protein